MKILWIVNTLLGPLGERLVGERNNGVWMDAMLEKYKGNNDHTLTIATTYWVKEIVSLEESGIRYCALPDTPPILYNENKQSNISAWKKFIEDVNPDIIQVWGTEFTHGLCALRTAKNIPSVIYMQGYLTSIARHYFAGITEEELRRTITFRDIVKRDTINKQRKKYEKSAVKEQEMFRLAHNIICENDWCENSIRAQASDVNVYRCPLSVSNVFSQYKWNIDEASKHSVICNASGYSIKGLHMLLRACALLKEKYPDIKVCVPGDKVVSDGSIKSFITKRGYSKYIEKLIRKLDVEKNIVWLGRLSQKELAQQYTKHRAFVMCSSIENHSSSLKEAMIVGVPSIASSVGGVPEYVINGHNGFLYRFEEYDILASYIDKLFIDDDLCRTISVNASQAMNELHSEQDIYMRINEIYTDIKNKG